MFHKNDRDRAAQHLQEALDIERDERGDDHETHRRRFNELNPMGRLGEPADITEIVSTSPRRGVPS